MTDSYDHSDLLSLLKSGEAKTFEMIYERFADRLYRYVYRRVNSKEVSEEIVQEIFISLWGKRDTVEIATSLNAYLFGAAKFRILTYIRSERVRKEYAANFALFSTTHLDNSNEEMMNLKDLQYSIDSSISELPEKCRMAFRLSRMEHEPISRIAERMNISKRTVENYLSQALKHLRTSLGEYLTVLILWMIR
jgi:RNA polymerase sigma-70 factor (family 1)